MFFHSRRHNHHTPILPDHIQNCAEQQPAYSDGRDRATRHQAGLLKPKATDGGGNDDDRRTPSIEAAVPSVVGDAYFVAPPATNDQDRLEQHQQLQE